MKKTIALLLVSLMVLGIGLSATAMADRAADLAAATEGISLPAALIRGFTYELPSAKTEDETLLVTVNGQACDGTYVAEGTQAVITYADSNGVVAATYTLPIIDTKGGDDQCAYFYNAGKEISMVENENDLTLSFAKDAQVSFINQLSSEGFALYLSFVEGATNFEKVTVKLTDAVNAKVTQTFTVNVSQLTVSQNSQNAELAEFDETLQLRYKNSTRKLTQGNDNVLLVCDKDDSRNDFSGFSAGVYLTVGFEGVTGNSSVKLNRVSNQALGHKNSTAFDMAEPVLALTSPLYTTQNFGETFNIPTYKAHDVLSQLKETSVKVEAPDGTVYTEAFPIEQYGKYKLTFIAKDTAGNTMKTVKMIFVNDDVVPQLQVNAMEKTTYKVGDVVAVPGYTASDNLNACNVDVILLLPNAEIRLLTHDAAGQITYCISDTALYNQSFINDNTSFKAEQTGTYTIRYVAYDDQYNRVTEEVTFTVE